MSVDARGIYNLPDLNIPDAKKDKHWHKQYVEAIAYRTFDSAYDFQYKAIQECQDFYQGVQSGDEFDFLQTLEDGSVLPAKWINFNKVKTKINLLVGELLKKGYQIDTTSINKEAKVRKLMARENARVDLRMTPYALDIEQTSEMPLQKPRKFEDEQELEDYYNYTYKEKSEIIMKSALDWSLRRQRWEYERIALFRDMIITNHAFAKTEIINGVPYSRRIDPKFMIWDRDAEDDFLTDASYFGEVRYMNIAEAAQKYNLTKKQIGDVYAKYKTNLGLHHHSSARRTDFLNHTALEVFTEERGELKVLIIEAYWVDYKKYVNKISVDKFGNEHVKTMSDETKVSKDIVSKNIKIWRKGVLIGGELLVDWGEIKNQPRGVDDFSDTGCPYHCLIPNYINRTSTSMVEQVKGLQNLKNITMYGVQLAMARAGSKGFIYDVAQMPDGWDIDVVMKYLKVAGIAFINSAQDEAPTTFNQFQDFDMTISASVKQYIEINLMIDREIDAITGVNEARQGFVQNSSQAVGVTQSAILQSSLSTENYFHLFNMFCENIYNYSAGLIKIAWAGKERFAPIIGDVGVDFLASDIDLALDDYAVYVEEIPEALADKDMLHQMIIAAVQAGSIDFIQGFKILQTRDVDYALRQLERYTMKQERKAEKMQKEQLAAQMQQQQQASEAQAAQEQSKQSGALDQIKLGKSMDGKNALSEIVTKGKIDLVKQDMKETGDTRRAQLQKIAQESAAKEKENKKQDN